MKKAIASVGLLAIGTLGAQNTHAQFAAGSEKPWTVSGTLRGFYDDNINTQPNGPGRVSSTGFEVRPTGTLDFNFGPTTLRASYTYALLYYTDREPTKVDQNHDFELFMNHNFNERYTLDVTESFVVAQEPDVLAPGSQSLYLRANGGNIRNTGLLNFHAGITRLFGVVLGYANTWYDYSQNSNNNIVPGSPSFGTLLDRIEQAVSLDTTWRIWEQTTGIFGYKFGWVDYTGSGSIFQPQPGQPNQFIPSSSDNNYSHYVYVGADTTFRSDLSASARVGIQDTVYYQTVPGAGTARNQLSPYADLSLTWRYMDSGSLVAGFHNARNATDIPATIIAGKLETTQDQESATVYANIIQTLTPLSPKLTATVTAQYQNSTYNGGQFNASTDNIYLLGLNLNYRFTHYVSCEVGYNYDDVVSVVPGLGYDRNRVYIGVTASY